MFKSINDLSKTLSKKLTHDILLLISTANSGNFKLSLTITKILLKSCYLRYSLKWNLKFL